MLGHVSRVYINFQKVQNSLRQDKILRRKRLITGANFIHVYKEIWDKGKVKFHKFSM